MVDIFVCVNNFLMFLIIVIFYEVGVIVCEYLNNLFYIFIGNFEISK